MIEMGMAVQLPESRVNVYPAAFQDLVKRMRGEVFGIVEGNTKAWVRWILPNGVRVNSVENINALEEAKEIHCYSAKPGPLLLSQEFNDENL